MLQALLDETSPQDRASVTAVGGFVFDQSSLDQFAARWTPKIAGLSKPFRSAACYEGQAPFDAPAWTQARRHALLQELAELTAETMLAGFVVATRTEDYRQYLDMHPDASKFIDSPYKLCVLGVLASVQHWAERYSRSEAIHYWFESGARHETEAWESLRRMGVMPRLADKFRVGSFSLIPRASAPALCSADLLVWEWQRHFSVRPQKSTGHLAVMRRNEARPLYTDYLTAMKISHSGLFNLIYQT